MASHVVVQTDASEQIKPIKKKSTDGIDEITALVVAMGRATLSP